MENLQKKFYPVIHCVQLGKQGVGHALHNTHVAMENGADGVFLIGHDVCFHELSVLYEAVRKQFPKIWVGINFLDISCEEGLSELEAAANRCRRLDALWIDGLPKRKLVVPSTVLVFGGVAFKYREPDLTGHALADACTRAFHSVDIATTSGDRTGSAPSIEKLKSIKYHLRERMFLALASGVDASNVSEFARFVDIFLVASSICERRPDMGNADYLVPKKVRELAELIHS